MKNVFKKLKDRVNWRYILVLWIIGLICFFIELINNLEITFETDYTGVIIPFIFTFFTCIIAIYDFLFKNIVENESKF